MNDIVVTVLGSISPYCKDNMNCPGFLIEYKGNKILLDAGNGITSLLSFPECLNNLNVIITHSHKDHYGDLGSIEYASYVYHNLGVLNDKINIYLPDKTIPKTVESYSNYHYMSNDFTIMISDMIITLHNNNSHSINSYMIKLETKDFKIIYTSDVGNSNISDIIDFCRKADLLICDSSLLTKYNSNNNHHLTAYEAANIAKLSKSKVLLLNHFWPEESKNEYLKEAKKVFNTTEVAIEGKQLILRRSE